MRLGIASPLKHESAEEWARAMREIGCRSVVFPLSYEAVEEAITSYAEAAKKYDLVIAEVGIWRNVLAEDPEEQAEARQYAHGQLMLAEKIGARCCVNCSGTPVGKVWDAGNNENYTAECREEVIRYTKELLEDVSPQRTSYCLEPMPWMIPTGPDDYLRLLEEVDHPAFKVHMDFINMVSTPERYFFMEDFLEECFAKLGPYITSCHLKDVLLRHELTFQLEEKPATEGIFPLEKFSAITDSLDPEMPVIIEHLPADEKYLEVLNAVQERLGLNDAE